MRADLSKNAVSKVAVALSALGELYTVHRLIYSVLSVRALVYL